MFDDQYRTPEPTTLQRVSAALAVLFPLVFPTPAFAHAFGQGSAAQQLMVAVQHNRSAVRLNAEVPAAFVNPNGEQALLTELQSGLHVALNGDPADMSWQPGQLTWVDNGAFASVEIRGTVNYDAPPKKVEVLNSNLPDGSNWFSSAVVLGPELVVDQANHLIDGEWRASAWNQRAATRRVSLTFSDTPALSAEIMGHTSPPLLSIDQSIARSPWTRPGTAGSVFVWWAAVGFLALAWPIAGLMGVALICWASPWAGAIAVLGLAPAAAKVAPRARTAAGLLGAALLAAWWL